jgi:hypothetical protein
MGNIHFPGFADSTSRMAVALDSQKDIKIHTK